MLKEQALSRDAVAVRGDLGVVAADVGGGGDGVAGDTVAPAHGGAGANGQASENKSLGRTSVPSWFPGKIPYPILKYCTSTVSCVFNRFRIVLKSIFNLFCKSPFLNLNLCFAVIFFNQRSR